MPSAVSNKKDVKIIFAAVPAYGHTRPFRMLARAFSAQGYSTYFLGGTEFSQGLDTIPNLEFIPLQGKADFFMDQTHENALQLSEDAKGPEGDIWAMENVFFKFMGEQYNTVQTLLKRPDMINEKCIMIYDSTFCGLIPMLLGVPGQRRVPTVGIGHFPIAATSKDTPPFGLALPDQGEAKNQEMNEAGAKRYAGLMKTVDAFLEPFNVERPLACRSPWDAFILPSERFLQLCIPELEPPRSDLPKQVKFVGALYGGNDKKPLPEWFDSFIRNDTTGHPLFLVTSGTVVHHSSTDLILPFIDAARDLPVRVVVCGVSNKQPADLNLPSNTRWAEWIAFEQVFPYTACIVSNGGYNGINQALAAGIPMILAGTTEDKAEGTSRAAATGAAINLRVHHPTVEQLKDAANEVLSNPSYKERALAISKIYAKYDAVQEIINIIEEIPDEEF